MVASPVAERLAAEQTIIATWNASPAAPWVRDSVSPVPVVWSDRPSGVSPRKDSHWMHGWS